MAWSAAAFRQIVWPAIRDWCGGGVIQQVEGKDADTLDIYAGIDAWQVFEDDKAMRGIASRIQYDTKKSGYPYNTFSIRKSRPVSATEYEKRLASVLSDRGLVYPHLTVQAYLDDKKCSVLSVAACRTKDLFLYVDMKGIQSFLEIMNADRSSTFIAVKWSQMIGDGVKVKTMIARERLENELRQGLLPLTHNIPVCVTTDSGQGD